MPHLWFACPVVVGEGRCPAGAGRRVPKLFRKAHGIEKIGPNLFLIFDNVFNNNGVMGPGVSFGGLQEGVGRVRCGLVFLACHF